MVSEPEHPLGCGPQLTLTTPLVPGAGVEVVYPPQAVATERLWKTRAGGSASVIVTFCVPVGKEK